MAPRARTPRRSREMDGSLNAASVVQADGGGSNTSTVTQGGGNGNTAGVYQTANGGINLVVRQPERRRQLGLRYADCRNRHDEYLDGLAIGHRQHRHGYAALTGGPAALAAPSPAAATGNPVGGFAHRRLSGNARKHSIAGVHGYDRRSKCRRASNCRLAFSD